MKVFAYNYRQFDEAEFFQQCVKEWDIELGYTEDRPTLENCDLAAGYPYVSVFTNTVTAEMLDRFKELGVKMIGTRSIGYDHIDIAHAKEIGMIVTNITYDPEGVAEYTVMDILMAVRRVKEILAKAEEQDFRFKGLMARELKDLNVGIVGAGQIGISVLRDLSGFGCRLYYTNRRKKEAADKYAEYVSLDELLSKCDVVSLHLELNEDTYHIIDSETLAKMKQGSILVNTARGSLVDSEALIEALQSGHLSGAALDVMENELGLYFNDCRGKDLSDHFIRRFMAMPNVISTQHMAFYYREAIRDMVCKCLYGMKMCDEGKEIPLRLV